MEVGAQRHAPAALPPGKTRYSFYRRLGGTQGRSGRVRKISPPPGFDPQTVQPVYRLSYSESPFTILSKQTDKFDREILAKWSLGLYLHWYERKLNPPDVSDATVKEWKSVKVFRVLRHKLPTDGIRSLLYAFTRHTLCTDWHEFDRR